MNVLDRKLLRDLFNAKLLIAAILGIIIIGTTCFVAFQSNYYNLDRSRTSYYNRCRMADFSIALKKIPVTELSQLEAVPEVTAYRPRISFQVTVALSGVKKPLAGQVLSLPDTREAVINDIVLKQGDYFTSHRQEEVIISDAFARERNIAPGDSIEIIMNNRLQKLYVVGTAISSEFIYLIRPGAFMPDPGNYSVFYIKHSFAEETFDMEGACNEIVGHLAPQAQQNPDRLLDQIEQMFGDYGVASTTPRRDQTSHQFLKSEIDGLKVTATFLPGMFLCVAAVVLNVLMIRLTEKQRTIVGTLKALGYDNRQLFLHFFKFSIVIGLLGGLIGNVLGYYLGGLLTDVYSMFYEFPSLTNQLYPQVMIIGIGISLVFSIAGAFKGTRNVISLPPAEAMRSKPPATGKGIWLEGWRWFWNRLSYTWHIALRSVVRSHGRTFSGIFAAMMGTMLMMVAFALSDSMYYLVDFQFEKTIKSDFDLVFKETLPWDAFYEAKRLPGVTKVEPQFQVGCTLSHGLHHKKSGIIGLMQNSTLTSPCDEEGNPIQLPKSGLVISSSLAKRLDVNRGDTLVVTPVTGRREPKKATIVSIVDSYLGLVVYADFHYLNRLVGEESAMTSVQLSVEHTPQLRRQFYQEVKQLPVIQSVNAIEDEKQQLMGTIVKSMLASMGGVVLFAGILFFGSILNASLISISEREREIATLRVLGYGPWEVGTIFLRENLLVNFLGTIAGLLLSYWMTKLMLQMYDTDLFRLPFIFNLRNIFITFGFALFFTLTAHLIVQRTIHHMDWRAALQMKE